MFNSDLMVAPLTGNEGNGLTYGARRKEGKSWFDRKDNIRTRRIQIPLETEGFPDDPFDPVPVHRPFDFPVHADSDSAAAFCICTTDQSEPLAVQSLSLAVNPVKLPTFPNQGML